MMRKALLAIVLAFSTPSLSQTADQPGNWPEILSAEQVTLADLQRMATDFGNSGIMQLRIAQAAISASEPQTARAALWRYLEMGGALSQGAVEFVRPAFDDAEWPRFEARMAENTAPISSSALVTDVPAELGLIEGIAHIGPTDTLVASSVTERAIYALDGQQWESYGETGSRSLADNMRAGSLLGMAYDAQRGWLWVASSVLDQTPEPETAFSGVIGIGPGRDEVLWMSLPQEAQPGDVALGPGGIIYVSGSSSGGVYARRIGDTELEELIPPGRLRSPQGMAVTPDGLALIIADYSYGLARFDFQTGELDQLAYDGPQALDGIDGLLRHGSSLIAIRNGVRPHGIMRITLNRAGDRITAVEPLERIEATQGEPTLGSIDGNTLYYISGARWDQFGDGGVLNEGAEPRATSIRVLPLQ